MLATNLDEHFRLNVEIDSQLKREAKKIYKLVKSQVQNYILDSGHDEVTLLDMGSSPEGLKVVAPDEYDVMLVVINRLLRATTKREAPGYSHIHYPPKIKEAKIQYRWIQFDECMDGYYLSPDLVRRSFQSMMQKIINDLKDKRYKLKMRQSGPGIEVSVSVLDKMMIHIDFVPTVQIQGEYFVAKPFPSKGMARPTVQIQREYFVAKPWKILENTRYDKNELLWRKSFSHKEQEMVALHLDENWKKAIMMWKAARLYSPQLQALSSYHFKIIGLHLAQSKPRSSLEDCAQYIGEELISGLEKRNLPHIIYPQVNLFEHMNKQALENVKQFLSNRFKRMDILTFFVTIHQNRHRGWKIGHWCKDHVLAAVAMTILTFICIIFFVPYLDFMANY